MDDFHLFAPGCNHCSPIGNFKKALTEQRHFLQLQAYFLLVE